MQSHMHKRRADQESSSVDKIPEPALEKKETINKDGGSRRKKGSVLVIKRELILNRQ